jgi:hypothetical protein
MSLQEDSRPLATLLKRIDEHPRIRSLNYQLETFFNTSSELPKQSTLGERGS